MKDWLIRLVRSISVTGLLIGTLFFAASLSPSLLPRSPLMQGVLSGSSMAAGYGLGVFLRWLWLYLELPVPRSRHQAIIKSVGGVASAATVFYYLHQAAYWQNSIRLLMDMEPVDTAAPFRVGFIALGIFCLLVVITRGFDLIRRTTSGRMKRYVPHRVSSVLGILAALALFWSIVDGVVFRYGLRVADASFQGFDALFEDDVEQPEEPMRTGSDASLLNWNELGRTGRRFISSGPTGEDLRAYFGEDDLPDPIRVFVGLNSAPTVAERAELALEEMIRVGAFERSRLVIVTPTGTGWIDPAAMDTLEYLHRGDVASVGVQYSYLTSWLSLLVEPSYGVQTARAVFNTVYGYWRSLPEDERPELYLHGLSLGALNSERASDIYDIIGDPFDGALWSGMPFASETWRAITEERAPGSPAWLPRFRDSSIVRFTNQDNHLNMDGTQWGPVRIVYLQYASDPVTFFEPTAFYREPAWMAGDRGPDVSSYFRWFPIVTLLQLGLDMSAATTAPMGYGHVYAPEHYIDAWMAVTQPQGWSTEEIDELKRYQARLLAREPQLAPSLRDSD